MPTDEPAVPRVFLVDDDPMVVSAMRRELRHLQVDLRVHVAPLAALEEARLEAPDILITDLTMPDLDGLELIRAMRQLNPQLRVVVVSTGAVEELWKSAELEGGVRVMLAKPWPAGGLRKAVEELSRV